MLGKVCTGFCVDLKGRGLPPEWTEGDPHVKKLPTLGTLASQTPIWKPGLGPLFFGEFPQPEKHVQPNSGSLPDSKAPILPSLRLYDIRQPAVAILHQGALVDVGFGEQKSSNFSSSVHLDFNH